jgi:UDP-2-acetamido-2,6-beta-L-arabino-hexul-4-ose reductase
MMKKILITGSGGFIGKNLVSALELKGGYEVLSFTRDNDIHDLKGFILRSDFIFHLAGEVRSDASSNNIISSNVSLTKDIINILEKENRIMPILYTSSIHADTAVTEYGKTKKASEILIHNYSEASSINCYIYKLPHIFGEFCKPNYNSVISTWIYNTINNIDIYVQNKDMMMHYIYVQDLVQEFIDVMESSSKIRYIAPNTVNIVSLGQVIEYLEEFKNCTNKRSSKFDNDFEEKLYKTYLSYL